MDPCLVNDDQREIQPTGDTRHTHGVPTVWPLVGLCPAVPWHPNPLVIQRDTEADLSRLSEDITSGRRQEHVRGDVQYQRHGDADSYSLPVHLHQANRFIDPRPAIAGKKPHAVFAGQRRPGSPGSAPAGLDHLLSLPPRSRIPAPASRIFWGLAVSAPSPPAASGLEALVGLAVVEQVAEAVDRVLEDRGPGEDQHAHRRVQGWFWEGRTHWWPLHGPVAVPASGGKPAGSRGSSPPCMAAHASLEIWVSDSLAPRGRTPAASNRFAGSGR